MKVKTLKEMRSALTNVKVKSKEEKHEESAKKTFLTIPYYTPSDSLNIDEMSEKEKKAAIRKGKLMGTGDPITINRISNRQTMLKTWLSPNDFTYDPGTVYKAWGYAWIYLAATVLSFLLIHPLVAVIFAWKTGHNWGQYVGTLAFGKEDFKGKTMYNTK